MNVGQTYTLRTLKSIRSGVHNWDCSVSPPGGILVGHNTDVPAPDSPLGDPIEKMYSFLAQAPGIYTVYLQLSAPWEAAPIDEMAFKITVT